MFKNQMVNAVLIGALATAVGTFIYNKYIAPRVM